MGGMGEEAAGRPGRGMYIHVCMYDELERGSKMGLEAIAGAGRLPRADEPS